MLRSRSCSPGDCYDQDLVAQNCFDRDLVARGIVTHRNPTPLSTLLSPIQSSLVSCESPARRPRSDFTLEPYHLTFGLTPRSLRHSILSPLSYFTTPSPVEMQSLRGNFPSTETKFYSLLSSLRFYYSQPHLASPAKAPRPSPGWRPAPLFYMRVDVSQPDVGSPPFLGTWQP